MLHKAPTRLTQRRGGDPASDTDDDVDVENQSLTSRQKRECLRAFSLFFPGVPEEVVKRRRIGIDEIAKAAALLKGKMKVEEVCRGLSVALLSI